jgi:hypothetical protein
MTKTMKTRGQERQGTDTFPSPRVQAEEIVPGGEKQFLILLRHLGLQLKMCGLDEKSGRANNSPTSIVLNQTSIH